MRSTTAVSIRMPVAWRDELFARSLAEGRTVSDIGREVIEAGRAALGAASDAVFTLRAWGDEPPTREMLADDLERIAGQVREGYLAGEAAMDEDFPGRGWWDQKGFEERQ